MRVPAGWFAGLLCLGAVLPETIVGGVDAPAKQLTAEAVLDRYVQVTGGLSLYRRYGSFRMYSTVTREDRTTFNTAVYHSRDGGTRTEIDAGADSGESGVSNGIVWEYSEKNGVKILSGKVAERRIAEARGLDADDWRIRFPSVKMAGVQTINGKTCYHLRLTRTDGSVVERFYDASSGLLVREISKDFDEAGTEEPVTTDIEEYDRSLGVTHPSLMHVKAGSKTLTIRVDSLTYSPGGSRDGFEVPRDVVKAVAERRGGGGLPNAVDLVEKFIEATGGSDAYRAIKTETVKAEIAFPSQNLKFPLVVYATQGKMYTSLDVPSMGKFEFGSDGTTTWERSVVLGPRLQPRSKLGGWLGPNPDDVLRWTDSGLTLETLGKDDVNGSPCYKVKMGGDLGGEATNTACFDAQTGLLVKATSLEMEGSTVATVETKFSDYQSDGGFKTPHHMETKVAGQQAIIQVNAMEINGPLPEGVFELPADVRALREKKMAELKNGDSEDRPTIKKK